MIVALIAQSLLMKNWSGFRENKKGCVFAATCIYLFGYIVYLMYMGTCYEYVFFVMNLIYVWYIIGKCLDPRLFARDGSRPNDTIINFPV